MNFQKHKNDFTHTIVAEYNTKIKTYANGEQHITYHSYSNLKGICHKKKSSSLSENSEESREYQKYKNLLRAKSSIIDLIYHNGLIKPWQYFVTLTLDPKDIDSMDYEVVSKALAKWLNNMKHQNPDMSYVMTPELHKSGRIHFHGVFRDVPNWKLVPAINNKSQPIKKDGLPIYNLSNYKYGFTTVSEIQNQEAVSVYVSKYVTKDLIDKDFKKKYWCSRNLERPEMQYAMLNEDSLQFYIDKYNIKDYNTKETENSKGIFCKLENCIIYTKETANNDRKEPKNAI